MWQKSGIFSTLLPDKRLIGNVHTRIVLLIYKAESLGKILLRKKFWDEF